MDQRLKYDVLISCPCPAGSMTSRLQKVGASLSRQQLLQEYSEKRTRNLSVLGRYEHTVETAAMVD